MERPSTARILTLPLGALPAALLAVAACSPDEGWDLDTSTDGRDGSETAGDGVDSADDGPVDVPDADAEECRTPAIATDLTIDPYYADSYVAYDLGSIEGMPPDKYGGLVLLDGDTDTLLIGGHANYDDAWIYSVPLDRSCEHIVGFAGPAEPYAAAPYIDGSIVYADGTVILFTGYPVNTLGEIRPGGTTPALTVDLALLGIPASVGSIGFVPPGFPGEGSFKLVPWPGGGWYEVTLVPDGGGLFDPTTASLVATLPGGPEGFAYVPRGSAHFETESLIVSEWSANTICTYEIDTSGNPVVTTRRLFLQGLTGAEGAYFDLETGDFLFSTWTSLEDRVVAVRGFERPDLI